MIKQNKLLHLIDAQLERRAGRKCVNGSVMQHLLHLTQLICVQIEIDSCNIRCQHSLIQFGANYFGADYIRFS